MTTSQDWWPADCGHYGPLFIRMSWHAAGTYRIADGRGGGGDGAQRFAPLNSWPDNASLDKARRLLLAGQAEVRPEALLGRPARARRQRRPRAMGFQTFGFGFGREDIWEPEEIFWGPEDTWLGDERYSGDRELDRAARRRPDGPDLRQPRGPERQPRPAGLGPRHPRDLPPDGDERRGDRRPHRRRPHLRQDPRRGDPPLVGPGARGLPRRAAGPGLEEPASAPARAPTRSPAASRCAWTPTPTQWDNGFFETLFGYEWELTESPAGAKQWQPKDAAEDVVPDAHDRRRSTAPMMLTSDLALRIDPAYEQISPAVPRAPRGVRRRVRQGLVQAAAPRHGPGLALPRARGCPSRSCGRTRCPPVDHELVGDAEVAALKATLLASGLTVAAAGAHGVGVGGDLPRHRQPRRRQRRPASAWSRRRLGGQRPGRAGDGAAVARGSRRTSTRAVRRQAGLARRPDRARRLRRRREGGRGRRRHDVTVPFTPGRTDASQEQTDVESFAVLEPQADGFRNYVAPGEKLPPETLLLDRAYMLELDRPGDDGPGRRPARARRQHRRHRGTACSPTGRAR